MPTSSIPGLRFPDERPLSADELEQLDAHRLEPVIRALAEGLKSYWGHTGRPESDMARVWGIHGALGQGKSTVVSTALHRIEQAKQGVVRPRVHGWNWIRLFTQRHAPRRKLLITTLEASQLKAEHLNTTVLSRLVLPRLVLWALPMSVLTTGLLFVALLVLSRALGHEDWLFDKTHGFVGLLVAVLALPVVATLKVWWKSEYSAGYMEQAIYQLARWTGVAPDLVVLDDLDRATVDQQRAVLRTLVRHTRLLHCPLVVCFDETDFLASDPNPEDPAELLRKLIQVPLRLPPRSREDAVLLAWGAAKVWLQYNPGRRTWATFLSHPVWIGHLARVMLLTESVGPRRAKGLLADVVAAAETLYPLRQSHRQVPLAEASALLLLSAIHQMHPALRRDAEWLVSCLEAGGDDDAWKRWSEAPRSKALFKWTSTRPREEAQIRSLLKLADAMLPINMGWRGVVFGSGGHDAPGRERQDDGLALDFSTLDRVFQPNFEVYRRWVKAGHALDRIAQGIRGTEAFDKIVSSWVIDLDRASGTDTPAFAALWPMLIASLTQWPEHQRLRVYAEVFRWLERESTITLTLPQHWLLEWAVDRSNADRWGDDFWLKQIKPSDTSTADAAATIRFAMLKALRRHRKPSPKFLQQSWQAALELARSPGLTCDAALVAAAITQNGEIPPPGKNVNANLRATAQRYWPAVRVPAGAEPSRLIMQAVLTEHLWAARTWQESFSVTASALAAERDADDRPWSVIKWMASHEAEQLDLKSWLRALAPLCAPHPDASPSGWSFAHWSAHFVYHAPTAMGVDNLSRQLAAIEELDVDRWSVALCLLVQGWHRGLDHHHRLQLGQALIRYMPPSLPEPFAIGAISAWLPLVDELETAEPSQGQPEHVRFLALPLIPADAMKLMKRLLDAIEPTSIAAGGGVPHSVVDNFLQSWSPVKSPQALTLYRLAKEHWENKIPYSSGSNFNNHDGQSLLPDDLF